MSSCDEAENIGMLKKGQDTLENQVNGLFDMNALRQGEIMQLDKKIIVMTGSIEELRTEVHNVSAEIERVKTDVADIKSTAKTKAVRDHEFQVEMREEMKQILDKIDNCTPTPKKDGASLQKNAKTVIALSVVGGFVLLGALLIITGQAEHFNGLWGGLSPMKPVVK